MTQASLPNQEFIGLDANLANTLLSALNLVQNYLQEFAQRIDFAKKI